MLPYGEIELVVSARTGHNWKSCSFRFNQVCPISTHLDYLHITTHRRRESLIGVQERYKWDHGGSNDTHKPSSQTRKIRAETNCPRCTKHMDILFSNRHFPTSDSDSNSTTPVPLHGEDGYQAVNLCPNCRTAYYFRPYSIAPLQGTFVEIGRVTNSNVNNTTNKNRITCF